MMGSKARVLTPVRAVSLDELVPADHFYRHLNRVFDLSFVCDLVQDRYAAGIGRPRVDPQVFFKLQLVMFFEGIRSERQPLRLADRLDVLIISAEFGLLEPDTLIPDYDRRMTPARARQLQSAVSAALDAHLARVPYAEIFINLGKTYRIAIEQSTRLRTHPHVTYASGRIGFMMSAMKQWLARLR